MKISKTLVTSVLAGFAIGIGGLIYLSVENKVVGAALFSIGLFVVLTFSLSLFTGKICYVLNGDIKTNLINVVIIWCGNFIGAFLLAVIILNTRTGAAVSEKALALCQVKNGDTYLSLFLLGFLCNIFIFIAVDEYKNNDHIFGKYMAILLSVMGFILAGTEHCVADMFYYNIARAYTPDMILRLLVITLGNSLGGISANFFARKVNN